MFRGGLGKGKACFFLYEVDTCLGIVAEGKACFLFDEVDRSLGEGGQLGRGRLSISFFKWMNLTKDLVFPL